MYHSQIGTRSAIHALTWEEKHTHRWWEGDYDTLIKNLNESASKHSSRTSNKQTKRTGEG